MQASLELQKSHILEHVRATSDSTYAGRKADIWALFLAQLGPHNVHKQCKLQKRGRGTKYPGMQKYRQGNKEILHMLPNITS